MLKLISAIIFMGLLPVAFQFGLLGLIIWLLLVVSQASYINKQDALKKQEKMIAKALAKQKAAK